jgi:uncharacterized membrane protein YgcG
LRPSLLVPILPAEAESIEEYAVEVFNNWKLDQKGHNNGVLVIVVPQDRKMRIEVGYGLEPILTDAMAGAIIRDVMTPAFKRADYDAGVQDGVAAIIARLEGKNIATAAPEVARQPVWSRNGFQRAYIPWPEGHRIDRRLRRRLGRRWRLLVGRKLLARW